MLEYNGVEEPAPSCLWLDPLVFPHPAPSYNRRGPTHPDFMHGTHGHWLNLEECTLEAQSTLRRTDLGKRPVQVLKRAPGQWVLDFQGPRVWV